MDIQDFKDSTSGKCVKTLQGYYSFIPNNLQLKIIVIARNL